MNNLRPSMTNAFVLLAFPVFLQGCEILHREVDTSIDMDTGSHVGDAGDVGDARSDTGVDAPITEQCEEQGQCGPCGLGEMVCTDAGELICEGAIDLESDGDHCGHCDHLCGMMADCEQGHCEAHIVSTVRAIACPGMLELFWEEIDGAQWHVVEWTDDLGGDFDGGGVDALQGPSGLIVGDLQQVSLNFEDPVEGYYFRVTGHSSAQVMGRTQDVAVTLPQSDLGQIVDDDDLLIIPEGAVYMASGQIEKRSQILIDGTLCVEPHVGAMTGRIELRAPKVEVGPQGALSATGGGYGGGGRTCIGQPGQGGGGGSYGGQGHIICGSGGGVYGDGAERTVEMGSGGGGATAGQGPGGGASSCSTRGRSGGAGGGAILLEAVVVETEPEGDPDPDPDPVPVPEPSLVIAGLVVANGTGAHLDCGDNAPDGGAGSGGGILLEGMGIEIMQSAYLSARGGSLGHGGGGGRIKIFDGATISTEAFLSADAGGGGAEDGTVYIE